MLKLSSVLAVVLLAGCASTPMTPDASLLGGTTSERIISTTWKVQTGINGWTSESQLKPQMLQHLARLASTNGFASVRLSSPVITRGGPCECYSVEALATFSLGLATQPNSYNLDQLHAYDSSRNEKPRLGSATLLGPARYSVEGQSALAEAVFFDAVGFGHSTASFSGNTIYYVPPGEQKVLVWVRASNRTVLGQSQYQVEVPASFQAGKTYRLSLRLTDGKPQPFVEEVGPSTQSN
jgi:hypothetical protein